MRILKTPFHESISARVLNSNDQEFIIWGEPAYSPDEIHQNLNYRRKLLQTMFLYPTSRDMHRISMFFNFDAELISVNEEGFISDCKFIKGNVSRNHVAEIQSDCRAFYILANPGFSMLFGLVPLKSSACIGKRESVYETQTKTQLTEIPDQSTEGIVQAILSDMSGKGLRSKIPHIYVWYNDVLFVVNKLSFPGYAASGPASEAVFQACLQLKSLGIEPVMREAVYGRIYMSNLYSITPHTTWWGMENQGKFIKSNMID